MGSLAMAAGLALATAALRLPFRGGYLFDWDSLQFALGIQHFNLAAHRPHPPGYIGYILAGRLLTAVTGDVNTGLVALSVGAEAVTVAGIFLVARRLFGTFAGVAAAVLLATSPLFWLYGETALTYGLEAGLALLAFWLCYRAVDGGRAGLALAAAVVGLEGAVRPTTAAFLLPLLMYAALAGRPRRDRAPRLALVAAAGVAACAAWAVPLLWLSGGPGAYVQNTLQLAERVSGGTAIWRAGWWGFSRNAQALLNGVSYSVVLYLPLALAAALAPVVARRLRQRAAERATTSGGPAGPRHLAPMLALWCAPAFGFFALVHIGQLAYVLFAVSALLIPAGPVLERLAAAASRRPGRRNPLRGGMLAALALANTALFVLPQDSLSTLPAERDRHVSGVLAVVRARPAGSTILVTDPEGPSSYRVAQYYLAEYSTVALGRDDAGQAGELFSNRPGAPEYDVGRFHRVGPLSLPTTGDLVVLDGAVLQALGDPYRLVRSDTGTTRIWTTSLDPADPPRICRDGIYLRASDCGRVVNTVVFGLRVGYPRL